MLALLGREVRGRQATLLVLDGLVSAEGRAGSGAEFKKFIHLLQGQATLSGCTMLLLTSAADQVVSPGARLLEAVRRRDVRRVFIDGLGGFQQAATEPARMEQFVAALANELRRRGATTLYTVESPDIIGSSIAPPVKDVSSTAENLILTRYVEYHSEIHRIISVLKLRDGAFDPKLRKFVIRQEGIVVEESFAGAEAVLSGYARDVRAEAGRPTAPESREAP